jgi:hypothetical protein
VQHMGNMGRDAVRSHGAQGLRTSFPIVMDGTSLGIASEVKAGGPSSTFRTHRGEGASAASVTRSSLYTTPSFHE